MIVRISTESQYRLPEDAAEQLNELDNQVVTAVDGGDEDRFHEVFEQMLDLVRRAGQPLDEDELEAAGAFDDQLSLSAGQDDIDRELHQLTSQSAVDDDLERMKAELGQGSTPPQQSLGSGESETKA